MPHLVLDEPRIPAGLEKVGGVRAAQGVDVDPFGEPELGAVAPDPAQERRLDDESAAFAGEQVEGTAVAAAVGEPVLEDARRPAPHREHAAALVGEERLDLP